MGRNKKKPFYEMVKIEHIGSEGKAIARVNDVVVFTKMAVPGDVVDIQITKKRKKFQEGFIKKYHSYSKDRIDPFCEHFGVCGGCKWQFLPYQKQIEFKQRQVVDQLSRIGKIELPQPNDILFSKKNIFYRNKLEFTFSNNRWLSNSEIESDKDIVNPNALGFHVPSLFDKIVNIDFCWLQDSPSNEIRNFIYQYANENYLDFFDIKAQKGFLRTLIIRTSSIGETMIIVSFFKEMKEERIKLLDAIFNKFPKIISLMYVINSKGNDTITDQEILLYKGRDHIYEQMEDLKFKIGPKSFYQTNSEQAYRLYNVTRNFAGLQGTEIVYDLYTGTGTIANFIASKASKVVGIEYVPEAIEDAKYNSQLNNISNTKFYSGDMKDMLTNDFIVENGKPDVIITDPPRAGMHAEVVNVLLQIEAEKIVYVSCNPATQARDISLLDEKYMVTKIQPVDMFPHTHHVENIVLLEKRV